MSGYHRKQLARPAVPGTTIAEQPAEPPTAGVTPVLSADTLLHAVAADLGASLTTDPQPIVPNLIYETPTAEARAEAVAEPVAEPITEPVASPGIQIDVHGQIPVALPEYPDEDTSAAAVLGDSSDPLVRWQHEVLTVEDRAPWPQDAPPTGEPQFMYIAGTAGTGKTTLARLRATGYDDAMLCATTGIAAVNLGGTTINSVLRYYDTASMQTEYEFGRIGVALKQLAASGYTRLIVDEVSMMDGLQLDILMLAVDEVNDGLISQHKTPLGVTLVGDFAQLPPVKAPFVFQRPGWARFEPHTLLLTEPRRQADPDFVRALQAVRRGDMHAAEYFAPFLRPTEDLAFDGSNIMATNAEVDRVNTVRMLKLAGPETFFRTVRTGEPSPEWKLIPDLLVMKPTALVMILANRYDPDTKELIYANGDLAHFIEPAVAGNQDSPAKVRLLRNGEEVAVQRIGRDYGKPTGAKGVKKDRLEKKGSISYMPLRVAYATTVHKSQGLSLDNVQVMINSRFWMNPGMLYVALSRARTPQGLKIIGSLPQLQARIRSNPLITRWL